MARDRLVCAKCMDDQAEENAILEQENMRLKEQDLGWRGILERYLTMMADLGGTVVLQVEEADRLV